MASAVYAKWKTALMNGDATASLAGSGTTGLYCALIDTDAAAFSATDEFFGDLAPAGVVASDVEVLNTTVGVLSDATVDGDDLTFPAVTGAESEALVLYIKNAGANTTWRLVAFIDSAEVVNLPLTPNSGSVQVLWNPLGIFTL